MNFWGCFGVPRSRTIDGLELNTEGMMSPWKNGFTSLVQEPQQLYVVTSYSEAGNKLWLHMTTYGDSDFTLYEGQATPLTLEDAERFVEKYPDCAIENI